MAVSALIRALVAEPAAVLTPVCLLNVIRDLSHVYVPGQKARMHYIYCTICFGTAQQLACVNASQYASGFHHVLSSEELHGDVPCPVVSTRTCCAGPCEFLLAKRDRLIID